MRPRHRGLALHDLHVLDIRPHALRHAEGAGVGEYGAVRPHAGEAVAEQHDGVFHHAGDEDEEAVVEQPHAPRQASAELHRLGGEAHVVVHQRRELREVVVTERRVHARLHGEDEVAQRLAREVGAQIHRHGERHGLFPDGPLPPLLLDEQLEEHRSEVFGYGRAVAAGLFAQRGDGEEAHRDVEGVKGLRRAAVLVGAGYPRQGAGGGPGVAEIGVLALGGRGRLVEVRDALAGRDVHAALPQVLGQQVPEEGQRPRAVREGVKDLEGDAAAVIVKADEPAVVLVEAHGAAGVGHVLAHEGAGRGVRLEVVPEKAAADLHGKAGEARQRAVHGGLEQRGVHVLRHDGGEAVYGGELLALDGGVHKAGVVHAIPGRARFIHGGLRGRLYKEILTSRRGAGKGNKNLKNPRELFCRAQV